MHAKPTKTVVAFLTLALSAAFATAETPREVAMPLEVASAVRDAPVTWISVRAALTPARALREDKLGRSRARFLVDDTAARQRADETARIGTPSERDRACGGVFFSLPEIEHYQANATFGDLLKARNILAGRVIDADHGFYHGTPATLLRVRVDSPLRTSKEVRREQGTVLLVYPDATIEVEGAALCSRVFGTTFVPSIGDDVLVFSFMPGAGVNALIVEADAEREMFFGRGGTIVHAPKNSDISGIGFQTIVNRTRAAVQANEPSTSSDAQ